MREFVLKNGGILKDKVTSKRIYFNITTCLLVIITYGLIVLTLNGNFLKGILLIVTPIITNLITEYIYYIIKKDKKKISQLILEDYSYLTGILLGLLVSINTNYFILFIVSIIITIIKLLEGGMFRNIVNPVVIGAVILNIIYPIEINYFNQFNMGILFNNSINIIGGLSTLLVFISFIYLLISNSVKRNNGIYSLLVIIVLYLITILFGINNFNGIFNILFGSNLLFCITFLNSDNIITPLTKKANIFSGIIFGFIYMILLIFNINNAIYAVFITNLVNIVLKKMEIKYDFNR